MAPTPAAAMFPFLPFVLMAKKDPNFKAQNPYDKKAVKKTKTAKKSMKKSKKKT